MEGGFALQYADPGPASFCSNNVNRNDDPTPSHGMSLQPNVIERAGDVVNIIGIKQNTIIHLIDVHGRIIASDRCMQEGVYTLRLPTTLSSGRYHVRLVHPTLTVLLPLLKMM
jgi:hypothetical protein